MPWELDGNNPGANQFLGTRQDDPLRIKTRNNVNSAPAMIILPAPDANNTGNVGIGTPKPETLTGGRVLHIDNPNGPSALRLGAGATGQQWEWQSTVIGGVGAAMNLSKVTPPAFNPLTVLANGNVGIGTTAPNAKLEINNGDLLFRPPGPPQPGPAGEDPGDIRFESAGGGQKGRIWSNPVPGAGLFLSSGDNTPRIIIRGDGTVEIPGPLIKRAGAFRIDHPLDPESKHLQHSFVESPDMKNVYDGVQQLNADGSAWVELPEWFDALNQDFRYQLTAIGGSAPELYVAEEISGNRFRIAGGKKGMKVSWQVTGIRKDEWAEANRLEVELEKREVDRTLPEAV